jgi:hypothetical protein
MYNKQLFVGNCHEYEGRLYCKEDYLKLLKDICSFCHKPVSFCVLCFAR